MEIINYSDQISTVYHKNVRCEFCAQTFDTISAKNAHILDHFKKELCLKCDQNLLRIGEQLYVLHSTITCIETRVKQEMQLDTPNEDIIFPEVVKSDETDFYEQHDTEPQENVVAFSLFDEAIIPTEPVNIPLNEVKTEFDEEPMLDDIVTHEDQAPLRRRKKKRLNVSPRNKKKPPAKVQYSDFSSGNFSCDKCGSTNLTKGTFIRHHENPDYMCSECRAACCKVSQLRKHYHDHHPGIDPNQGIDTKCNGTIAEIYARRKTKMYVCEIEGCNEMISTTSRQRHLIKFHQMYAASYTCDICKKSFNSLYSIRIHMHVHGAEREISNCSNCGQKNLTKETLVRHHSKLNFQCQLCDKRYCLKKQLKKHHIDVHCGGKVPPSKSILEKKRKKYKCPIEGCDELVSSNSRSFHLSMRHKLTPTQCDICKKIFNTKTEVKAHILRIHAPSGKKFKCEICGNKYLSQSQLKWHHKITHIRERNFMCSECGKTFIQKAQLDIHITRHTGEKPFPCTFEGCPKLFRTKVQRVEHMRSHTGEKPYSCDVEGCDRRFAYAIDLKRHKFNSHGIYFKKYPCPICSEILPENMLLKKHMKKHGIQT